MENPQCQAGTINPTDMPEVQYIYFDFIRYSLYLLCELDYGLT